MCNSFPTSSPPTRTVADIVFARINVRKMTLGRQNEARLGRPCKRIKLAMAQLARLEIERVILTAFSCRLGGEQQKRSLHCEAR